ncbi:hypothetical protein KHQ89_00305 [Mycoplasmatota bacterium]|nr:hypothetical protein KHQ89_00305 [Mycoplasmatota bacterium]
MRGPFGWFTKQDETSPMVLLALGVGVTPIRALLNETKDMTKQVNVVYASNYYLFKKEIDQIVENNNQIHISYVETIEETEKAYTALAMQYKNTAYYYISGNKASIDAISKKLKNLGIKKSRLIFDPFLGY